MTEWSEWFNNTDCVISQGICGIGIILWSRYCTPNDTRYANEEEKCKEYYSDTNATNITQCFISCFSMYTICYFVVNINSR